MDLFRTFRYARRYANWRDVLRAHAARRNPRELVLRSGVRFEAPPEVNAARAVHGVYYKRCYTPPGFEIQRGDLVVDVGANVGVFAVYAAGQGAGRVIAVEPFPANLSYLRRNLEQNGVTQAEVVGRALSDRSGPTKLFVGRKGVTHQLFERDASGPLHDFVEVPSSTLADLLDDAGVERVDLLKMDCEGAEGLVLRSTPSDVLARIARVAMEFHDYASPLHHDELGHRLEAEGFAVELRWDGKATNGFLYARRAQPAAHST